MRIARFAGLGLAAAGLALSARAAEPQAGETVWVQDREVYVRPPNYDTSAIGARLGYVRRTEGHGISAQDWAWTLDFADRALSGAR